MKALKFIGAFACVIGAIGGIGYSFYSHQPVTAVCIGVLAFAAFPTVKQWVKDIISPDA